MACFDLRDFERSCMKSLCCWLSLSREAQTRKPMSSSSVSRYVWCLVFMASVPVFVVLADNNILRKYDFVII
jgi:hypothetical protein